METTAHLSWSVEQRLEFIEFRLFWEGRVNRADLVEFFGISIPQASSDLSRYQDIAAGNLRYDRRARAYVAEANFTPRLLTSSARRYLTQLRSIADEVMTPRETWLGWIPPFGAVPLVRRRLEADKLREILTAIRTSSAICVRYQSLNRPEAAWRWLTPHALVFDGFRWHARSWCHERQDFRDFVLARMLDITERRPDELDPSADLEWQLEVTVRLGPHPDLGESQQRAIELDYGMEDGVVEIPMRLCLAYYLERQLGLDLDPKLVPPQRLQVILLNRSEIEALRQATRAVSKRRVLQTGRSM